MARRKRTSPAVDRASKRSSALESIDAKLDLGNGLTLAAYNKAIDDTDSQLSQYNTKLSEVDGLLSQLEESESNLDELSGRMLAAVGVKYGKNSEEYEQAGGTRTSERKTSGRAKASAAAKAKCRHDFDHGLGLCRDVHECLPDRNASLYEVKTKPAGIAPAGFV